jgi:F-type H+-transporting ATPase subunit b
MDYRASEFYKNIFDFDILFMDVNTPLYILVLVLIVMFCMHKLLFQPILRTLDARRAHADDLRQQQAVHEQEIEGLVQTYQRRLDEVKAEVARLRQDARADTQKTVQSILERARREADSAFQAAMTELQGEVTQARAELAQRAAMLAERAASRILNV